MPCTLLKSQVTWSMFLGTMWVSGKRGSRVWVLLACAAVGCGRSKRDSPPVDAASATRLPIETYAGRVELPARVGPDMGGLSVRTGLGGLTAIKPDGTFIAAMNTKAVGAIVVERADGTPILFTLIPKHPDLLPQPPRLDAKSTVLGLLFALPGFVVTEPRLLAMLMDVVGDFPETAEAARVLQQDLNLHPRALVDRSLAFKAAFRALVETYLRKLGERVPAPTLVQQPLRV